MFDGTYRGKRVLVTGHTGFKGSWLTAWLLGLGAEVAGYAIGVPTRPSHFAVLGLANKIKDVRADIGNRRRLDQLFATFRPQIVFHLAAQSLVRRSFADPHTTFATNAIGTLNVLEAIRSTPSVGAAVIITSDKCYRNNEWHWGYRENDTLGGTDPYSASKACAELITASYAHSYFAASGQRVATVRAGNVIGGGDWAQDRLVPDGIRAWSAGQTLVIRSPKATRPWQHVLEPLSGYLWLGRHLWHNVPGLAGLAFNFGPAADADYTVEQVLTAMVAHWPEGQWRAEAPAAGAMEHGLLKLNCDRALRLLGWRAVLDFPETIAMTTTWYRTHYRRDNAAAARLTQRQIDDYTRLAKERRLPWTC